MEIITRLEYRINLDDLDFMGIIGHHQWVRLLERFRTEAMKDYYKNLLAQELHLAVVHVDVKYKAPARYDEKVVFLVRLEEKKRSTLLIYHEVTNEAGQLLLEAQVKLACIDGNGKIRTLPELSQ